MFRYCAFLAFAFFSQFLAAQTLSESDDQFVVHVPGLSSIRSDRLALTGSEQFVVSLESDKEGLPVEVNAFVHDQNGTLVGLPDPDNDSAAFRWHPSAAGRFYLLLQNLSQTSATVTIRKEHIKAVTSVKVAQSATVRVFYATNRSPTNFNQGWFNGEPAPATSYGFSDVSIPRDHRMGELEGPSIFRLEFGYDPSKHVTVRKVSSEQAADFYKDIAQRVHTSNRHEIFVFVHGFNVEFPDALRRTAQLSYDLAFDGPSILFSWPSQGRLTPAAYRKDQRNAELSASDLQAFLRTLVAKERPAIVHVIAHSMGNRVLFGALRGLASEQETLSLGHIQDVALIAPDIDGETFRRAGGEVVKAASRVTLYASAEDIALKASMHEAGYARAGQTTNGSILITPGVDTIDASAVRTSALGLYHQYYADNATMLSDLFHLFRGIPPKERFGLLPIHTDAGDYWKFRTAAR